MQLQLDAQGLPVNGSMIPQGDDRTLVVTFYKNAQQNNFKSEQEGRPIFDDMDFVKILTPGDRNTVVDRPVKAEDKVRFGGQWKEYLELGAVAQTGTPVEHWARLTPSQIAEAKHSHITTVEQMAGMSDTAVASMGSGWLTLREEAKAYLKKSKDAATAQHYAAQLKRAEDDIAMRDQTIADLAKRLEALEKKAA